MSRPILHLHQRQYDAIAAHARSSYPEECCGFLFGLEVGSERTIHEVHPIVNSREDNKERRFLITPDDFIAAEARARSLDLNLIGFYHTHPDHPAIPSDFDREHALPYYSYIIQSVRRSEPAEVRSYQLNDDRTGYHEEKVIIHNRVAV
ncbi:MAG: M67 family metallopeptidase [bacterium]|nr:M67 family metallopeptidase [bacterium]